MQLEFLFTGFPWGTWGGACSGHACGPREWCAFLGLTAYPPPIVQGLANWTVSTSGQSTWPQPGEGGRLGPGHQGLQHQSSRGSGVPCGRTFTPPGKVAHVTGKLRAAGCAADRRAYMHGCIFVEACLPLSYPGPQDSGNPAPVNPSQKDRLTEVKVSLIQLSSTRGGGMGVSNSAVGDSCVSLALPNAPAPSGGLRRRARAG